MSESDVVRRYGNLRRPSSFGVFGFGLVASVAGFVLLIFVIVTSVRNLAVAAAILLVGLGVLVPARRSPVDGHTGYGRGAKKIAVRLPQRTQVGMLVQGPAGATPDGSFRLPGIGATVELVTCRHQLLGEVAFVHKPEDQQWSIVLECAPDGNALVDAAIHDRQVDWWGGFLGVCGDHPEIVGMQAIIDTAPDTGARLAQAVNESRSESSPDFAREVMDTIVREYPAGQATIRSWVTVTFCPPGRTDKADRHQMLDEFCNIVPTLLGYLRQSGAGQAIRVLGAAELTDTIRCEFDPSVALDVEQARQSPEGTGLRWQDAGPAYFIPEMDRVRHDRCQSMSWQMVRPPAGVFTSDILSQLLAPTPRVLRKRVALCYRPMTTEDSQKEAEKAVNQTRFRRGQGRRVTEAEKQAEAEAVAMEAEQAKGAKMVRFSMVVTQTVREGDDMSAASSAFDQMRASARLRVRPALGCQDTAFLASLPLGLVVPRLSPVTPELEQKL